MFQNFLFIIILVLALFIVLSDNLRHSVIYLSAFSLAMALAYLHFNAPDVALAEAAIGVGLSTVMYLVALKKVRVYDICYVNEAGEFDDKYIFEFRHDVIRPLEEFLEQTEEIEPQVTFTDHSIEKVIKEDNHDFIIQQQGSKTYLYGQKSDVLFQEIVDEIDEIIPDMVNVEIVYLEEVSIYDAEKDA
jgi:uncharacterized MnhB-related membrane protein